MISIFRPGPCRTARAAMLDGIEGRLAPAARYAVEDHVASCARCADELSDLAAAHHAVTRALAPYRRIRPHVAPARARLAGAAAERPSRAWRLGALVGRMPQHAVAFAVLALAFVGSVPATPERVDVHADVTASYVRAADDPGGLLSARLVDSERIPVGDGLVIDVSGGGAERAADERLRQGLQPSSAR